MTPPSLLTMAAKGSAGCSSARLDHHLGVADDGGQRCAELVADGGEEVLLGLARLGADRDCLGQRAARLLEGDA
jgi:hypothetical protein